MRDFQIGYAPAAETAANAAGELPAAMTGDEYIFQTAEPLESVCFGLGIPTRFFRERGAAPPCPWTDSETEKEKDFRTVNKPLPDGTVQHTMKQLRAMMEERARRAEVAQRVAVRQEAELAEARKRQDEDADLLRKQVEAAFDICVAKGVIRPLGRDEFAQAVVCGGLADAACGGLQVLVGQSAPGLMFHGGCGFDEDARKRDAYAQACSTQAQIGGAGIGAASPLGRALAQQGSSLKGQK